MEQSNVDGKAATASKAEAQAAGKVGTTSGGDVITRIPILGKIEEKEPTGIGYDGDVWVHWTGWPVRSSSGVTPPSTVTGRRA